MLYAIVALVLLLADQGVKYWTTTHIALDVGRETLLPGLIDLRNIRNTGSAFSFLGGWSGARWLFLAVTVLFAVLVILALAKKLIRGGLGRWTALIVLAGALGNAIDRCLYGYVIDMFEFAFFPSFPVFNVADVCITVCGILFCIYVLLNREPFGTGDAVRPGPGGSLTRSAPKKEKKKEPEVEAAPAASAAVPATEAKPVPAPVPAKEKPAAPAPEEKKAHRPLLRRSAPEKSERDLKFESLKRPVAPHESFLEMTQRKPGEDPFAEWTEKAETPVRIVVPEEPTRELPTFESAIQAASMPEEPTCKLPEIETAVQAAPAPEEPAHELPEIDFSASDAEELPAMEAFDLDDFFKTEVAEKEIYAAIEETCAEVTAADVPVFEEEPVIGEEPAPEEVQPEPETTPAADVDEDPVYSLEDILNEFRDL